MWLLGRVLWRGVPLAERAAHREGRSSSLDPWQLRRQASRSVRLGESRVSLGGVSPDKPVASKLSEFTGGLRETAPGEDAVLPGTT